VDVSLGIHQNGLVPAGADIMGYDVLGHVLTLLLPGQLCFWITRYVNRAGEGSDLGFGEIREKTGGTMV
jgi:hypothetical protein